MKTTRHDITHSIRLGLMLATGLAAAACSQEEDVKPDPSQPVITADGQTDAQKPFTWVCPQETKGSPMVLIPTSDGNAYCIDKRETLYSEYKAFLDAKGSDTSGQPDGCSWNTSFVPDLADSDNDVGSCVEYHWRMDTEPNRPVNCMNFCNAWSYCQWAGKRLCGVRGANPDKLFDEQKSLDAVHSTTNEWFNTCSQGGTTKYPYGDTYEAGACIDQSKLDAEGEGAKNVSDTAKSTCRGTSPPYSEVVDLSGSQIEWVNVCRTDGCALQGGAFYQEAEKLSCEGTPGFAPRSLYNYASGVRCCADAVPAPEEAHAE